LPFEDLLRAGGGFIKADRIQVVIQTRSHAPSTLCRNGGGGYYEHYCGYILFHKGTF
jgi:hypothetical protein